MERNESMITRNGRTAFLLAALLLAGCGTVEPQPTATRQPVPTATTRLYGDFTAFECESGWRQLDVDAGDEALWVNDILNRQHAPDSVGFALRECIENGWQGWR